MNTNELTDQAIRKAAPKKRPYFLSDGAGLLLMVNPNGSKLWRLRFSFGGKRNTLSFGPYPLTSLAGARELRAEARAHLRKGIDPAGANRSVRHAQKLSFAEVAGRWMAGRRTFVGPSSWALDNYRLTAYVLPALGDRPIAFLTSYDFLKALDKIQNLEKIETAHRTRSLCNRIMNYAKARGYVSDNPVNALYGDGRGAGALQSRKVRRRAALTDPAEVGRLLLAIDCYQGSPTVMAALRIAPYVFVRPGELRHAEWKHLTLDGEAPVWRIPAERMKSRREHLVPLSRQVVSLFQGLQEHTGAESLVFPSTRGQGRPMSNGAILMALRTMGYSREQQSGHGFRHMASTFLNELGVAPDLIELQLAHSDPDKTRAVYNTAKRLEDRRAMMQRWADHLDALREAARKDFQAPPAKLRPIDAMLASRGIHR